MDIERQLLWDAWPDGYLAARGVMTMAGWQCLGVTGDRSLWFPLLREGKTSAIVGLPSGGPPYERRSNWREEMEMFRLGADLGEFLPNVDPKDVATWACLLADLAGACFGGISDAQFAWTWINQGHGYWQLECILPVRNSKRAQRRYSSFPRLDSTDPALALVQARIQLRNDS